MLLPDSLSTGHVVACNVIRMNVGCWYPIDIEACRLLVLVCSCILQALASAYRQSLRYQLKEKEWMLLKFLHQ